MRTGDDCRLLYSAQGSDAYSAVDALARGDTDAAITILERAIAARPEDAALRNNYGVALMRFGRLDDAKREFERAIQLKRDYPDAFANLGQASLLLHDARAERDAKSARKALTRGKDDYLYVERALLEALRMNPNHLNALLTLALLRRRQSVATDQRTHNEKRRRNASEAIKFRFATIPENIRTAIFCRNRPLGLLCLFRMRNALRRACARRSERVARRRASRSALSVRGVSHDGSRVGAASENARRICRRRRLPRARTRLSESARG